ncbi:MAG: hypothetical protein NVS2B3_14880 [Vulcanimicrobiaceae bacterium]
MAGHLMHLYFAAVLPAAIALTVYRLNERAPWKRRRYDVALVLIIASTGHLPTTMVLMISVVSTLMASEGRYRAALGIASAALVFHLPTATAIHLVPGGIYFVKQAVTEWELAQSAPPASLLHFGGYLARYSDTLSPRWASTACGLVVALMPFGATKVSRRAATVIIIAAIAALLTMGLYGPLAPLLSDAFVRIPALSLFRELYDIVPVFGFGAVVAAAAGTARLASAAPRARLAIAAVSATACVLATVPTLAGFERNSVPMVDASVAARVVAALPGSGRVLWLPGIYPMGTATGDGEGYDPRMVRHGAHDAIAAYQPEGAVARAYDLLATDPPRARAWLQNLGCDWIAIDTAARLAETTSPPTLGRLVDGARAIGVAYRTDAKGLGIRRLDRGAPIVQAVDVTQRVGPGAEPHRSHDVSLMVDDPIDDAVVSALAHTTIEWSLFTPSKTVADPKRGFVLGSNAWRRAPGYGDLPGGNAVVTSAREIRVPAGVFVASDARRTSYAASTTPRTLAVPRPLAIVGVRRGVARDRVLATSDASLRVSQTSPTTYELRVIDGRLAAIVLRQTYDTGWRIVTADGRERTHFRANGWANGWLVGLRAGETARIAFEPDVAILTMDLLCGVLWIVASGTLVGLVVCSRRLRDRAR